MRMGTWILWLHVNKLSANLQRVAERCPKLSCTSLPLTPYSSASLSSAVASTCGWNRRCHTSVAAWWHVFHYEAQTPLWHSDLKHPRTIWVTAFARRMGWFVCFNCLAAAAYSGANLETFQPVWSKCIKRMLGQNTACRIKCQLSSRMISIRLNHFLSIKERWTVHELHLDVGIGMQESSCLQCPHHGAKNCTKMYGWLFMATSKVFLRSQK